MDYSILFNEKKNFYFLIKNVPINKNNKYIYTFGMKYPSKISSLVVSRRVVVAIGESKLIN